jgi:hypothetical protein
MSSTSRPSGIGFGGLRHNLVRCEDFLGYVRSVNFVLRYSAAEHDPKVIGARWAAIPKNGPGFAVGAILFSSPRCGLRGGRLLPGRPRPYERLSRQLPQILQMW